MPAKSSAERYGTVALSLHWASAALILALVPLGFSMQANIRHESVQKKLEALEQRVTRLEGRPEERV